MSVVVEKPQPLRALEDANRARMLTKDAKDNLAGLPRNRAWTVAAALLRDLPESVAPLELHVFLTSVPGIGRERMRVICQGTRVWPFRQLRELTAGERERLAARVLDSGRLADVNHARPLSARQQSFLRVLATARFPVAAYEFSEMCESTYQAAGSLAGLRARGFAVRRENGWLITDDGRDFLDGAL